MVADRIAAQARLRTLPRAEKRVAVLMPDYPGAAGRSAYAVGLDVPASIVALLDDLAEAGYAVSDAPDTPRALLECVERSGDATLLLQDYTKLLGELPAAVADRVDGVHGAIRPTIPTAVTAPSASAPRASALCWSRCRLIAGGRATAAPPITTPRFRRATR